MSGTSTANSPERAFEVARTFFVNTGATHVFRLPVARMSVAFFIDAAGRDGFPKYVLRSTDGAYEREKTAEDDLIPGDAYLQLVFDELIPERRYTMLRIDYDDVSEVLFDDVPFATIVDQPRSMLDALFGLDEAAAPPEEGTLFDDWIDESSEVGRDG